MSLTSSTSRTLSLSACLLLSLSMAPSTFAQQPAATAASPVERAHVHECVVDGGKRDVSSVAEAAITVGHED